MATLNSTLYTKQVAGTSPKPGVGLSNQPVKVQVIIAIPATGAGTALADTLGLFVLPKNCVLRSFSLETDRLDTNGSATLAIDVGYTGTTNALVAAWAGASGVVTAVSPNTVKAKIGAIGYTPTVDTPIFATINTAAATKAAGTLVATMEYEAGGSATS